MSWIRTMRAKYRSARRWATGAFLRPDWVTLYHRPAGWGDAGDQAPPGKPDGLT
jgi:hypothetical protein